MTDEAVTEAITEKTPTLEQDEALELWQQGRDAWNYWVEQNPKYNINFSGIDFAPYRAYDKCPKDMSYSQWPFAGFHFPDGEVSFHNAQFGEGDVSFWEAQFGDGDVRFDDAQFGDGKVNFLTTKFGKGKTNFLRTKFSDGKVSFRDAQFGDGEVSFRNAQFGDGKVNFLRTQFGDGDVNFIAAQFGDGKVSFCDAQFGEGEVSFHNAQFGEGKVDFLRTKFGNRGVDYTEARFGIGEACFRDAQFGKGQVSFYKAQFSEGDVNFLGAKFDGYVRFEDVQFGDGYVCFRDAQFGDGDVSFHNAQFGEGDVSFWNAQFGEGKVYFLRTKFGDGNVSFSFAEFGMGKVSFRYAEFGIGNIIFDHCKFTETSLDFSRIIFQERPFFEDMQGTETLRAFSFQHSSFEKGLIFSSKDKSSFGCVPDLRGTKYSHQIVLDDIRCLPKTETYLTKYKFYSIFFSKKFSDPEDAARLRRLKEIALANKDRDSALAYNAQELQAERHHSITNPVALMLESLYRISSDYGRSIGRPLVFLVVLWLCCAGIYATSFEPYLAYSAKQMFPLLGSVRDVTISNDNTALELWQQLIYTDLTDPEKLQQLQKRHRDIEPQSTNGLIQLVAFIQNILSLILLFLLGLGLRNRFKL